MTKNPNSSGGLLGKVMHTGVPGESRNSATHPKHPLLPAGLEKYPRLPSSGPGTVSHRMFSVPEGGVL